MKSLFMLLLFFALGDVSAHQGSTGYVRLTANHEGQAGWHAAVDVALRDLNVALELDANHDRKITWGEVRAAKDILFAYLRDRVSINVGEAACPLTPTTLRLVELSDGMYVRASFLSACQGPVSVGYRVLSELDTSHRGIVSVAQGEHVDVAVAAPNAEVVHFSERGRDWWQTVAVYFPEGVLHIWLGIDHLLFLLTLLLPCAQMRGTAPGRRHLYRDIVGVVTAFTIAHAVTLSLSVLEALSVDQQIAEIAIAATVLGAAGANLLMRTARLRVTFAFSLGLIHGFGFANALNDIGLPSEGFVTALFAFNLGIEVGQLLIVAALVPLLVRVGRYEASYRRFVVTGSIAIAGVALLWVVERSWQLGASVA